MKKLIALLLSVLLALTSMAPAYAANHICKIKISLLKHQLMSWQMELHLQ